MFGITTTGEDFLFEILDFLVKRVFDAFCGAEFFVEGVDFGDEVFV